MVDKLKEVYESDPLAMASAYGVEPVTADETLESAKAAGQFALESLPGIGTAMTVAEIEDELKSDNPNYFKIGMLAGSEAIGMIPGLGTVAKNMIQKGAKFKTKRGSVYTVEDQSRTTRERAPDTPDGDFVKQPTSGKTIYMSYEDMERFGPLFQKGEPGLYQFRPSGEGKAQLVFTKDYGPHKAGDPVPNTEVSFTLEPELGMNPVEIYDSTNNSRTSIHFGNEIVEVESDIPKVSRDKDAKPQMSNEEYDSLFLNLDEAETPEEWQQGAKALIKKGRVADPSIKTPELEDSTRLLLDNKITREEHLANVDKYKPVNPWDALPREPSDKALVFALTNNKRTGGLFVLDDATTEALGVAKSPLSVGMRFNGRLDIPAYNYHDTWIVAGTSPAVKTADNKGVTNYAKAIHYVADGDKPVKFVASPKTSESIGTGEADKIGYATVSGIVGDLDVDAIRAKAAQYLNDPEWTQVGFDPRRQGGFYVRAGENKHVPVREATEVIQIGPLVLARNAKLDFEYSGYNEGGMAMDEQMNAVFKSSRTNLDAVPDNTVGVDPESGNEIPLGSLPEEVRDDIPAQLSEGEYVVPADVVRYYGVKFFEDLRAEAKFGYQDMEENGRIGGEPPMGMEMIEPEDDMMFDISELEVTEVPDEPEAAFFGKLFGKKEESSPEDSVRERFEAASKRDNSAKAVAKRQAERKSKRGGFSYSGDDSGSRSSSRSSSSRAKTDFGFSGNPIERAERKYGNNSGSRAPAAGEVSRAYTPDQNEPTFAERINFGGNYAEGGEVDDGGRLGLGSEGIGLSSVSGGVMEVREYRNDAGHVLMIMFLDGEPLSAIPEGYYPVGDEPKAVVAPESSGTVEAVSDGDGPEPTDAPEPINYKTLTKKEMVEMLEEQQSMKGDVIAAGMGMVNPLLGTLVKFAMWDSSRRLEREIERRAKDPNMSEADRTDYEMMLEISKQDKPSLLERIFKGKDTTKPLEEQTYTPQTVAVDSQAVNDAVAEAMKYDPTAKTTLEDSNISAMELKPAVDPEMELPPVIPDPYVPEPYTASASEKMNPAGQGDSPTPLTDAFGTGNIYTAGKQEEPKDDNTQLLRAKRAGERASETVKAKRRAEGYRKAAEGSGSDDNLQLSLAELGRMAAPSDETLSPDYGDPRRGMMKKGGLASKKKKK